MSSSFEVNDPVSVKRDAGQPSLEGIVAHVGDVSFDTAGDWVGVRLTGASVGLGKNDGSVRGKSYFTCPANSGIFVKASALTKRNLSRLEQLRLRREIGTTSITATATSSSTASATTTTTTTPQRTPQRATGTTDASSETKRESRIATGAPTSASGKTSTRSKIEEIRKRRMLLQERKHESPSATTSPTKTKTSPTPAAKTSPVATPPKPTTPVSPGVSKEELDRVQQQVTEWQEKCQQKELENAALQQKLSQAEQEVHEANKTLQAERQTASTPVSLEALQEKDNELQNLHRTKAEMQDRLQSALDETAQLRRDWQREQEMRQNNEQELLDSKTQTSTLQKELQALADQSSQRGTADASHYKERARLQAQVEAVKRKVQQMEAEKLDLEQTVEELTLDKEQLLEEKEALEDVQEELKIDAETAQIQVDELRMELEDAQLAAERAYATAETAASGGGGGTSSVDAEDKAQALALQNARLRQALLRLREQSSVEKMDLGRQLRNAEKQLETLQAVTEQAESLRATKANLEDQINDLKDMLEQSSAFEGMVEDLSDRVLSLEEDNVLLQTTLREMEEAAELTAEMEEVQGDELKALAQDLEGRDTIIRNLEEAIKMQRRREEDYRRTVGNYRQTVETLKMEKQALLELQQGGEGEKNSLIASSQKALAKAAQLVSDAAAMRKREALAVMDKIDCEIYRHLSTRLESLLPQPQSVAVEVSAIKGELLTSKVVSKAAQSLRAIAKSFGGAIRPPIPSEDAPETGSLALSDETKTEVAAMFHQTDFAHDIAGVSSNLLRFLAAGQWPDLLSPEASTELGSLLGHSLSELDSALGQVLVSLKEEGSLTPEQSNIERLRQSSRNTIQHLESDMIRDNGNLVPTAWLPPGLDVLNEASLAKFSCMGAAAALSLAVHSNGNVSVSWSQLYNKVEQCSSQISSVCLRMANLDAKSSKLIEELKQLASTVKVDSQNLLQEVKTVIQSDDADLTACTTSVETTLRSLAKLSAILRSANLQPNEDGRHHAFSPEAEDTWARLSDITRTLRAIDGDVDDLNYLYRSRQVEHHLTTAVDNEPKLEAAQTKIVSLEKNLASRSKEISMQNARLSEMERFLAKSNVANTGRSIPTDFKSSKEYNTLMEENRVLMEAMDVLQRQVDEYENEIRVLKDFKAPRRGPQGNRTIRRAVTSVSDLASPSVGLEESLSTGISLEATLFRPALQQALRESSKWKAVATTNALSSLPPLPGPLPVDIGREDDLLQLTAALSDLRMKKASIKLVDLANSEKAPRDQFYESRASCQEASLHLETLALRFRGRMAT